MENLKAKLYGTLRRSESFFKTDMVYLARGTFWLNGAQLATAGISFLLAIAFANLLSQETYGTYKYILSVAGLLGSISLSGLGSAISRAVAKGFEGEFLKSVKFNLRWETLILIVSFTGASYYYVHGNHTLALGLVIIGIFSPFRDSAELYPAFLTGKKDFRAVGLLSALRAIVSSAWLLGTIIITQNPLLIVLSYFVVHTTMSGLCMWWVVRKDPPNHHTDNETISLAKHTSFISNVAEFIEQIDNVLVFHYLGPVSLAVYNFAQAIPEYLAGFTKNLGVIAVPKFAQADKETAKKSLIKKSFFIFAFGFAMSIGYILLAPTFFALFFPQYMESVHYSQVYSLILLFSAALPSAFISSQMAIKEKYVSTIITNVFKLIVLFIGLYYFGLWGLIIGRVVSKAFAVLMTFVFAARI